MMQGYIIFDFSETKQDSNHILIGEPKVRHVSSALIWSEIDKAKDDELKISIYKLGECLIDWS